MKITALQGNTMHSEKDYFEKLWANSKRNLSEGRITPIAFIDGKLSNLDYILTTVAVLQDQKISSVEKIVEIMCELARIDPTHYYYPLQTLHATLLGCTQRYKNHSLFFQHRISKVTELCSEVLRPDRGPVEMDVCGVNVVGSSIFLQAYPKDNLFQMLRNELVTLLKANGETPLEFSEKGHIHINIAKLSHNDPYKLKLLAEKILDLRDVWIGKVMIDNIDLIIADQLMSRSETIFIRKFHI